MKLFYCDVDGGNFGDDMNAWFWDALFPDYGEMAPDTTLFGIGSILWRKNFEGHDKVLVMGSGSGYGVVPSEVPKGTQIGFVRGPRTAKLLGLEPEHAITDPAAMVSTFKRFDDVTSRGDTVFIPHVGTAKLPLNWNGIAERADVRYLSPAGDSHAVIRSLASARLVLAESLHGAIIADAFRVPWVPVSISPTFNTHKWHDWAASLDTEIAFHPCLGSLKAVRRQLAQIKSKLRNAQPTSKDASQTGGTRVAEVVSDADKTAARKWVSRLAPVIEGMLVRDLVRAARGPHHLSADATLKNRQNKIAARVDRLRAQLQSGTRAA